MKRDSEIVGVHVGDGVIARVEVGYVQPGRAPSECAEWVTADAVYGTATYCRLPRGHTAAHRDTAGNRRPL